jgi:hypothetical protein
VNTETKGKYSKCLRYGQILFNLLYETLPNLSEKIRGSKLDSFHFNEGRIFGMVKQ